MRTWSSKRVHKLALQSPVTDPSGDFRNRRQRRLLVKVEVTELANGSIGNWYSLSVCQSLWHCAVQLTECV